MPEDHRRFDRPDRFVAGTVGEPGQRTFFLQASQGSLTASVALEKEQVSALADQLDHLLSQVRPRPEAAGTELLGGLADTVTDLDPLQVPIEEEFRVAALTIAWDEERQAVVLEAADRPEGVDGREVAMEVDSFDKGEASLQSTPAGARRALTVVLSRAQTQAFVVRARAVVAAGRPACPLCALPLDPVGHVCPRQNGHRRRP